MKNFIKTALILVAIYFIGKKIYEKYFKEPQYKEFADNEDGAEFDIEAQAEESLADKIKFAAKKVIG